MDISTHGTPAGSRRSRMRRKRTGKRIELSERDIEIFRLLDRYRYLRSNFLYAFVGGASETRFKERLGDLYHEGGYIDRPRQQWQFANCRSMPIIYELGDAGARVLREHAGAQRDSPLLGHGQPGGLPAIRSCGHDCGHPGFDRTRCAGDPEPALHRLAGDTGQGAGKDAADGEPLRDAGIDLTYVPADRESRANQHEGRAGWLVRARICERAPEGLSVLRA